MKKLVLAALALVLTLTVAVSAECATYPKLRLKMSTTVGEQSNAAVMAKLFAQKIDEASKGNIVIKVFPSDQLSGGNMSKGVEMLSGGVVDCAFEPVDVMAVLDKSLLALSLPWIFDNYAAAEKTLNGTGGQYINKQLGAKGIETIGFIHNGFRQLTNSKRPIRKPADLKAMKLRVPGGDVFVNFFKVFGADPVAMSFSELFTALQQKTVDGQENGFDLITANKFYEVQKYITAWNYSYGSFALAFNKKKWDSFDEPTKKLFKDTAKVVCRTGCQAVVDQEAQKKALVKKAGCEVIELKPAELDAFKKMLPTYYKTMKAEYGKEACTAFGVK